jgi:hypothetical protein
MANKSNPPNRGGSAPHVKAQPKGKGPIIGNMSSLNGKTRPWSFGKGSGKSMNFGKDVKKS